MTGRPKSIRCFRLLRAGLIGFVLLPALDGFAISPLSGSPDEVPCGYQQLAPGALLQIAVDLAAAGSKLDNACVFKEIAARSSEVWPVISRLLRSRLDSEQRAAIWAIRARKDAEKQHAILMPALRKLMLSDSPRNDRLSIAFAILNLGKHAVGAMPEFLAEASRPDLEYDSHIASAYIDLAGRTSNPGSHLAALLQHELTSAGTLLRLMQFLASETEGVFGEVIPPLRRLISRHAGSADKKLLTALVNAYVKQERPAPGMAFLIEVRLNSSAAFDDVFDGMTLHPGMADQLQGLLSDPRQGSVAAVALGKLLRRAPAPAGDSTQFGPRILALLSNHVTFDQGVDVVNGLGRPVPGAASLLLARYSELSKEASTRRRALARAIGIAGGLRDQQIGLLTHYAARELESARHLEPAGAVSSDALDALAMMPALSAEAVPDLIRSFQIVYGSPESRATVGSVFSAVSVRKVITALARSNSPEGAAALVSLSDVVSRLPTAYVPTFELHLIAQALADMGVHAVDAVSRKLSNAPGVQGVFLEAALAANVEPAAKRALAVHASLAWTDLLRERQDLHTIVGWTDQSAIHSIEYGAQFYATRSGGGFDTKWGHIPDTQDGMVIFRLGRLGLAARPLALDRLVGTLDSYHYPTRAAAYAVLANVRDKPAIIAALKRHLAKSNSEPIREFLGRLELPEIVDDVRY